MTSYLFHNHKLFYNYIILSIKTKIKHFYWHYKNNKYHDIIDPCVLTSDADANPNFTHYTSIFLNSNNLLSFDYEYEYYENIRIYFHNNNNDDNNVEDDSTNSRIVNGNEILFINEKDYKVRKKISNGLLIHPSFGRVVISTGGNENLRCKLPLREIIPSTSSSNNDNNNNNRRKRRSSSSYYYGTNSYSISATTPRVVLRIWWSMKRDSNHDDDSCSASAKP